MRTLDAIVPLIHVGDVSRTISFYGKLGFVVANSYTPEGDEGPTWVWLRSGSANLMANIADEPVVASQQAVLFYTYVKTDLEGLRNELITSGETPGPITHPFYLPEGEFRLTDPDGYTVMVAQDGGKD